VFKKRQERETGFSPFPGLDNDAMRSVRILWLPKPVADGSVAGIVDRAINHPSWGQFGTGKIMDI
jgi:hypothetical protein